MAANRESRSRTVVNTYERRHTSTLKNADKKFGWLLLVIVIFLEPT